MVILSLVWSLSLNWWLFLSILVLQARIRGLPLNLLITLGDNITLLVSTIVALLVPNIILDIHISIILLSHELSCFLNDMVAYLVFTLLGLTCPQIVWTFEDWALSLLLSIFNCRWINPLNFDLLFLLAVVFEILWGLGPSQLKLNEVFVLTIFSTFVFDRWLAKNHLSRWNSQNLLCFARLFLLMWMELPTSFLRVFPSIFKIHVHWLIVFMNCLYFTLVWLGAWLIINFVKLRCW